MTRADLDLVVSGLRYPECPRWHEGALWFSDQYGLTVHRVTTAGEAETVVTVPGRPAGLGWDPAGRLLVVSMLDRALLRLDGGVLAQVASFAGLHGGPSNELITSRRGFAYAGTIGFDFYGGEAPRTTVLTKVDPDGTVRVVADGLDVPNGMAWADGERRLVLAESFGHRLTVFDVGDDGGLGPASTYADLGDEIPDGICIDAEGAVWYASIGRHEVVRVRPGGAVLARLSTYPEQPYACVLGGPDGRTLFVCTARTDRPDDDARRTGLVLATTVEVPAG